MVSLSTTICHWPVGGGCTTDDSRQGTELEPLKTPNATALAATSGCSTCVPKGPSLFEPASVVWGRQATVLCDCMVVLGGKGKGKRRNRLAGCLLLAYRGRLGDYGICQQQQTLLGRRGCAKIQLCEWRV